MDLKLQLLRLEVKRFRKNSPRLTQRLLALIELTKWISKHGEASEGDVERIAAKFLTSARTLYRWQAAYRRGGVRALSPKGGAGRPRWFVRGHTAKKIREYRLRYRWGAEVIQAHLERDHGIKLSRYKIQRYLREANLILRPIRKREKANRHTRIVQVDHPGQHTQMDVKHLPHLLTNGTKCYVYNFVDHASKWAFKRAYDSYGPSETRDFMSRVLQAAPFVITRAQTDNGVEFTNRYISHLDDPKLHALDELCALKQIRHALIPVGEKELQGLVERSHRQDDDELFHRITPRDLAEFNQLLAEHCQWRNAKRRRKAIGWRTSDEFIADYRARIQKFLWGDDEQSLSVSRAA
jgi:transposase